MRNICAVHVPMPRTPASMATTSSSPWPRSPAGSSATDPSSTFVARSRMDAALLADRPTARSVCEESDKNRSGVTSPPSAAIRRPWMARAAGQLLVQDRADQSREVRLGRRVHPDRTGLGDEPAQDRIALGQDVSGRPVAAGRAGGYRRSGHVEAPYLWPVQAFADWAESHSAPGLTRCG